MNRRLRWDSGAHVFLTSSCCRDICLGKGFHMSFTSTNFSITWAMNDSGTTVFVANSHSFFTAAVFKKKEREPSCPEASCWIMVESFISAAGNTTQVDMIAFYFLPTHMLQLMNCGCSTDGLPCFLWWHFHTWLTVKNATLAQEYQVVTSYGSGTPAVSEPCIKYTHELLLFGTFSAPKLHGLFWPSHPANAFQCEYKCMQITNWLCTLCALWRLLRKPHLEPLPL